MKVCLICAIVCILNGCCFADGEQDIDKAYENCAQQHECSKTDEVQLYRGSISQIKGNLSTCIDGFYCSRLADGLYTGGVYSVDAKKLWKELTRRLTDGVNCAPVMNYKEPLRCYALFLCQSTTIDLIEFKADVLLKAPSLSDSFV